MTNQLSNNYIKKFIKKKTCLRYVNSGQSGLCFCGRFDNEHNKTEKSVNRTGGYSYENDQRTEVTDAYGEMKLVGFRSVIGLNPKYIRACEVKDLELHMYKIITHYWKIRKPELIISINGGAKKMIPLNNIQKLAFKDGLINVAKNSSTWIITGGFGFGVSKLAGEAARDYYVSFKDKKFTLIGIGAWGATINRDALRNVKADKSDNRTTYCKPKAEVGRGQAPLDPYHDVFILYDGNQVRKFGIEIDFRINFESYAAKKANCSVVQVIVEGGKKTVQTAATALDNGIPIVLMKGSKRAADVMCEVIECDDILTEEVIGSLLDDYKDEWRINEKEMEDLTKNLRRLKDHYKNNMVKIYSMSNFSKNLDRAILEAAFEGKVDGKAMSIGRKLTLSMQYNRRDVAEEEIFQKDSKIDVQDFKDQVRIALIRGQWEFMHLFIANGLTVESFLTKTLLEELYSADAIKRNLNSNVWNILNYFNDSTKKNLGNIDLIIRRASKNLLSHSYVVNEKEKTTKNSVNPSDRDSDDLIYPNEVKDPEKVTEHVTYDGEEHQYTYFPPRNCDHEIILTELDLFLWALLTQQFEMAKIFWENGKDHIGTALIASVICKSLAEISTKEGEIEMTNSLKKQQDEFQNMAISILTEAYWRDKIRTHLLLIRALPYLDRVSCMEMGDKHQMVDFLFHSACQTRLNAIWLGGMSPFISTYRIVINLALFPFTKLLIFPKGKDENKNSKFTGVPVDKQPDIISYDNPTAQEIMENEAAEMAAKDISDPIQKQEFLTKFRNQQQESWKNVSFCQAISIYYRAPITKFIMNVISYIIFLGFFSYFVLVELRPISDVKVLADQEIEIIVYIYIITYFCEEMRQLFTGTQHMSMRNKLLEWVSSLWNIFDLFLYIVFLIGVILRYFDHIDFVYARTFFALALSMYCFRLMQFYYAHQSLGPKVIMISRMLMDIFFFLTIYVIAVFAYGIFAQALLFPNTPLSTFLIVQLFSEPYWQTYGELNLEYVKGEEDRNNMTAQKNDAVIVAFGLFMLFSNVLLLNLLIAMFGNTFAKVEENSHRIWAFNRYKLIEEFYYRPILPPPLNVFELLFKFLSGSFCKSQNNKKPIDDFIANLTHQEDIQSSAFEQKCMEAFLQENPLFGISKKSEIDEKQSYASVASKFQEDIAFSKIKDANVTNARQNDEILLITMRAVQKEIGELTLKVNKIRKSQKLRPLTELPTKL